MFPRGFSCEQTAEVRVTLAPVHFRNSAFAHVSHPALNHRAAPESPSLAGWVRARKRRGALTRPSNKLPCAATISRASPREGNLRDGEGISAAPQRAWHDGGLSKALDMLLQRTCEVARRRRHLQAKLSSGLADSKSAPVGAHCRRALPFRQGHRLFGGTHRAPVQRALQ